MQPLKRKCLTVLLQAVNDLKSEKDKAILTLETAQVTKSLQVTPGASDKEEDKMLEVVREGIKSKKKLQTVQRLHLMHLQMYSRSALIRR